MDSKDPNQTAWVCRLSRVFAGRTAPFVLCRLELPYLFLTDPGSNYGGLSVPSIPRLHRLDWDGTEVYRAPGYNTNNNTDRPRPVWRSRSESSLSVVDCADVSIRTLKISKIYVDDRKRF